MVRNGRTSGMSRHPLPTLGAVPHKIGGLGPGCELIRKFWVFSAVSGSAWGALGQNAYSSELEK